MWNKKRSNLSYSVFFLTDNPQNCLITRSTVNCSEISLSARGYKGILYLENLGGYQLKMTPCSTMSWLEIYKALKRWDQESFYFILFMIMLKGWNTIDIHLSKTLQLSSIGGPGTSTVWTRTLWSTSPPCTRHSGRPADHRPSCHHLGFLLPSPHIFIPIDVFLPVTHPVTNRVMLCRNPWQTYKPNKTPKDSVQRGAESGLQ